MKRTFLAALAAGTALLTTAPAHADYASNWGITIQSCVVNQGGNGLTNGINVVYYNTHSMPATEVDFRIGYRGKRHILIDTGSFTQGAQINHNLTNDLVGFPWSGPEPNHCTVQRVVLANGTVLGP